MTRQTSVTPSTPATALPEGEATSTQVPSIGSDSGAALPDEKTERGESQVPAPHSDLTLATPAPASAHIAGQHGERIERCVDDWDEMAGGERRLLTWLPGHVS